MVVKGGALMAFLALLQLQKNPQVVRNGTGWARCHGWFNYERRRSLMKITSRFSALTKREREKGEKKPAHKAAAAKSRRAKMKIIKSSWRGVKNVFLKAQAASKKYFGIMCF
jgi:hypothetical protein